MEKTNSIETEFHLLRLKGFTVEKDFPNEYRFFYNPDTYQKVRVYYNGIITIDGVFNNEDEELEHL